MIIIIMCIGQLSNYLKYTLEIKSLIRIDETSNCQQYSKKECINGFMYATIIHYLQLDNIYICI